MCQKIRLIPWKYSSWPVREGGQAQPRTLFHDSEMAPSLSTLETCHKMSYTLSASIFTRHSSEVIRPTHVSVFGGARQNCFQLPKPVWVFRAVLVFDKLYRPKTTDFFPLRTLTGNSSLSHPLDG
jgi:hypothetical protein